MVISTKHDLEFYLADPATSPAALAYLQSLLDEQYGYDAAGAWALIGGGGLERLGLTRGEAVALGAVDREIPEPLKINLTSQLASEARSKRNQLIAETDYLVMPDYPIEEEKKVKVISYRQALRDFTLQESFPLNIEWPVLED